MVVNCRSVCKVWRHSLWFQPDLKTVSTSSPTSGVEDGANHHLPGISTASRINGHIASQRVPSLHPGKYCIRNANLDLNPRGGDIARSLNQQPLVHVKQCPRETFLSITPFHTRKTMPSREFVPEKIACTILEWYGQTQRHTPKTSAEKKQPPNATCFRFFLHSHVHPPTIHRCQSV